MFPHNHILQLIVYQIGMSDHISSHVNWFLWFYFVDIGDKLSICHRSLLHKIALLRKNVYCTVICHIIVGVYLDIDLNVTYVCKNINVWIQSSVCVIMLFSCLKICFIGIYFILNNQYLSFTWKFSYCYRVKTLWLVSCCLFCTRKCLCSWVTHCIDFFSCAIYGRTKINKNCN